MGIEIREQELLQYAFAQGIINLDDVRKDMKEKERQRILEMHPYEIWTSNDGRWRTYFPDKSKTSGRRMVAKKDRTKIEDEIIAEYKKNNAEQKNIRTIFKKWISYALEVKDIEKNTADRYYNDYDKYIFGTEFDLMDIRVITSQNVINFLKAVLNREEKLSRKAFSNLKTVLNGIFSYAKSELNIECISMSYTLKDFKVSDKKFKKVLVKDSEQVFSEEEASKIASYIIQNYQTTRELGLLLALLTGLRVGELSTLKYSDYEYDKLYIQRTEIKFKDEVGKTVYDVRDFPKTERSMDSVELSSSAVTVLGMIKKLNFQNGIKSEYLFYENDYGRLKSYFFTRTLRKICNAIDMPFRSMHKLRKTYASYLLANGVEEKIAQSQLRHKDSATTHKYYEFSIRNREYIKSVINENDLLINKNII